jgi:hypothetical protein
MKKHIERIKAVKRFKLTAIPNWVLMLIVLFLLGHAPDAIAQSQWESRFVKVMQNGSLQYIPDEKGNTIPDFSRVGYHQNLKAIPKVKVAKTLKATGINDQERIQQAIDELSKKPINEAGIRGAILLKEGVYRIPGSLKISKSGIVLRGEGDQTKLIATGKGKRKIIIASGSENGQEVSGTRTPITDSYVPVGAKSLHVKDATKFKVGDLVLVLRPGTAKWISDLKMDQLIPATGTIQWKAEDYHLGFERRVVAINGNELVIDNPIVMAMETQYGGGEVYKYNFEGRISEVGVENLSLESEYSGDIDEDHAWEAVHFNAIENSWISKVTSRYFGNSCVNLGRTSKQITVINSKCLAPKSQIIGGRRYSFNNDGQLNLVMNCLAEAGRHDYVTGAKVCGPNVFYNCSSINAKADVGPHHRWAVGTLYDNIVTDGEINIQDRGNWGTGHGWAGVNQVLWNCKAARAAVQSPYVSGNNYAIGLQGDKYVGRLVNRPDGIWEGQNQPGLVPGSLYLMQVLTTKNKHK